jgi:hypothetical protein
MPEARTECRRCKWGRAREGGFPPSLVGGGDRGSPPENFATFLEISFIIQRESNIQIKI